MLFNLQEVTAFNVGIKEPKNEVYPKSFAKLPQLSSLNLSLNAFDITCRNGFLSCLIEAHYKKLKNLILSGCSLTFDNSVQPNILRAIKML
jgi:hypothetical protein